MAEEGAVLFQGGVEFVEGEDAGHVDKTVLAVDIAVGVIFDGAGAVLGCKAPLPHCAQVVAPLPPDDSM